MGVCKPEDVVSEDTREPVTTYKRLLLKHKHTYQSYKGIDWRAFQEAVDLINKLKDKQ